MVTIFDPAIGGGGGGARRDDAWVRSFTGLIARRLEADSWVDPGISRDYAGKNGNFVSSGKAAAARQVDALFDRQLSRHAGDRLRRASPPPTFHSLLSTFSRSAPDLSTMAKINKALDDAGAP